MVKERGRHFLNPLHVLRTFGFNNSGLKKLELDLVKHIYDFKPLTKEVALAINPTINDFEQLKTDLNQIGYEYEGL